MLTIFENKSFQAMQAPPPSLDLRLSLSELRQRQRELEHQLTGARDRAEGLRVEVERYTKVRSAVGEDRVWRSRDQLSAAELEASRLGTALTEHKVIVRAAERQFAEDQTRAARFEAATLEREIVSELAIFAERMTSFRNQCAKIDNLRIRARQFEQFLMPSVKSAVCSPLGEVCGEHVELRVKEIIEAGAVTEAAANVLLEPIVEARRDAESVRRREVARAETAARSICRDALRRFYATAEAVGFKNECPLWVRQAN